MTRSWELGKYINDFTSGITHQLRVEGMKKRSISLPCLISHYVVMHALASACSLLLPRRFEIQQSHKIHELLAAVLIILC